MIRALNIALNAAHPDLPLAEAVAFVSSPTALFIRGVPRRVGKWALTAVSVAMTRPDGTVATRAAVESPGGVWTATLPGSDACGRTTAGLRIYADGVDETGAVVTGYVLGFADLEMRPLSAAPTPAPGTDAHEMWYYDEEPETPRKGDVCEIDGALKYYDGEAWQSFGAGGGTSDYNNLDNKPSINAVTLSGNKTAADLGLATAAQGAKADTALQTAPVASVNGKTGAVSLSASDVGALGNSGDQTLNNGSLTIVTSSPFGVAAFEINGSVYKVGISPDRLLLTKFGHTFEQVFQFKRGTLALLSDTMRFSTSVSYAVDNVVFYNGAFYRCTTAHTAGAWNASHFAEVIGGLSTGTPTAPTPASGDDSTKVATTAFVKTAISGISVTPLSGRTFDFATTQGVMDALKATIEALGGTVTNAPTTPAQNNQTQGE